MIAYNETLITTNFQVEPIIDLRDMGGQSSQNSLKRQSIRFEAKFLCLSNNLKFRIRGFCWLSIRNLKSDFP